MPDACARCGGSLGQLTQEVLFEETKLVCSGCQRTERIDVILRNLPEKGAFGWSMLTPWEQEFVESVRGQFSRNGSLTERLYARLEEVWARRI